MKKPLVIYHKNCDDGFGAAFAAWKAMGDAADYQPLEHGEDISQIDFDQREVFVLDFCFSPDVMAQLLPRVLRIGVVDHHKSALEAWEQHLGVKAKDGMLQHQDGRLTLFFDLSKSGAYLSWQYFHAKTPVPRMIAHISDGDLWTFEMKGTREFYVYLRSQGRSFAGWDKLCTAMQDQAKAQNVVDTGRRIGGFYTQQLDSIINAGRDVAIDMADAAGNRARGLAVNATKLFASELGNMLAAKSGTFALVWETDGVTAFCSLRSVAGFDCIPFAKAKGGGGHPQACGFQVPLDQLTAALRGQAPL